MITVKQSSARENFMAVLESAFEDYYPRGLSNDLAAITLSKLEEQASNFNVNEMIELACSLPQILNEDAANVTNPHIVQERKGKGISVTINGKEYRYVSPDRSTEDLFRSFMGMYKHATGGYKALNYLKKNALCYYGAQNPKGKELVEAYDLGKSIIWNSAATTPDLDQAINSGKLNESIYQVDGHYIAASAEDFTRVCHLLEAEGISYYLINESTDDELEETTQPGDIPPSTADQAQDELKKPDPDLNESVDGKSLFNLTRTGMSFYDDFLNKKDHDYKKLAKGLQGKIIMMSPDDYLLRLAKDIFHCSLERVKRGVEWDNVDKYADKMANGTKFDLPMLNLAQETQEGRHRALAAAKLGAALIPVLVITPYNIRKELGLPKYMDTFYGHSIIYTDKDGREQMKHVGLDEEKMKAEVKKLTISKVCDTSVDYTKKR